MSLTPGDVSGCRQGLSAWQGGEPGLGAVPNPVDVLCNLLSGDKLRQAQQLVGSLLNPDAAAQVALSDINLELAIK